MKAAAIYLASVLLALSFAAPARADWTVSPLKTEADGWTFRLGGNANLTGYTAHQSGGMGRTSATASAFLDPRLEKLFSNGWQAGIRATLNLYHDELSGDRYGNDVFQKVYLFVQTPYGRVEIGQQDGAAYKMAVTGPVVADDTAIDNGNIAFFRDPATGTGFDRNFDIVSAVFATQNAAKISYYSPRLLGIRVGASYTPHMAKDVLPFVSAGPHVADRQDNLFEGAVNYTGFFGRTSLGAYAGFAVGHNAQRTAGHDDLFDWGLGGEADYNFGGATLAVGAAWRETNGYAFNTGAAFKTGTTHAAHVSTKLTTGPWLFGLEYSTGTADAEAAMPKLDFTGYEASLGYVINSNLQLSAGWQNERFTRSTGVFYTGTPKANMNAGFLTLHIHV